MHRKLTSLVRIGLASVFGLFGPQAFAAEPGKPFVALGKLVGIVESLDWDYLKIQWSAAEVDHAIQGPEVAIVRLKGKWRLLYRSSVVAATAKPVRVELDEAAVTKFTKRLCEYMVIADREIDFGESLLGLTEDEKQQRLSEVVTEGGSVGTRSCGFSLELRQGGQTLTTFDAFAQTETMEEWMRSQEPNAANKPE